MAVSIEDILLAKAAQDEQNRPSQDSAITAGAILGSLGGVAVGSGPQAVADVGGAGRRLVERVLGNKNAPLDKSLGQRLTPGYRMAGGLVGAILGGALGAGTREVMMNESPAARMLARIQTTGELTASDEKMLEDILADTYSNTLGMG